LARAVGQADEEGGDCRQDAGGERAKYADDEDAPLQVLGEIRPRGVNNRKEGKQHGREGQPNPGASERRAQAANRRCIRRKSVDEVRRRDHVERL
jgi:hypothetical protein